MLKVPQIYKEEAINFANKEAKKNGHKIGGKEWKKSCEDFIAEALPRITMGRNPATKNLKDTAQAVFTGEILESFEKNTPDNEREKAVTEFKSYFGNLIEWFFEHLVNKSLYYKINVTKPEDMRSAIQNLYMRYYMAAMLRGFIRELYSLDPAVIAKSVRSIDGFNDIRSFIDAKKFSGIFMNTVEKSLRAKLQKLKLAPSFTTQLEFDVE